MSEIMEQSGNGAKGDAEKLIFRIANGNEKPLEVSHITAHPMNYSLPTIDLRDYVEVLGETEFDNPKENILLYTVVGTKEGQTVVTGDQLATISNKIRLTDPITADETLPFTYTSEGDPLNNDVILNWNTADRGQDYNTIQVKIELIAAASYTSANPVREDFRIYDTKVITLVVPELVTFESIEPKYDPAKTSTNAGAYTTFDVVNQKWNSVNVVRGLKAEDIAADKDLYNKGAAKLSEFWAAYKYASGKPVTDNSYTTSQGATTYYLNFFRIYGQTDPDGTVHMTPQSAIYNEDIFVYVPVVFNHTYCPEGTHETIVKVLFVK